jgi:hypothetical protein
MLLPQDPIVGQQLVPSLAKREYLFRTACLIFLSLVFIVNSPFIA